jgi:hypothetical protein
MSGEVAAPAEVMLRALIASVQAYLDGNYRGPRSYRPHECPHGTWYWETCENCIDDHFRAALSRVTPPSQQDSGVAAARPGSRPSDRAAQERVSPPPGASIPNARNDR